MGYDPRDDQKAYFSPRGELHPGVATESLYHLSFHDHSFIVEVASTPEGLYEGLRHRKFLPEQQGMLFDFRRDGLIRMCMEETYIPLDMIFIDARELSGT